MSTNFPSGGQFFGQARGLAVDLNGTDVIVADSGLSQISRVDTTAQFEFDNQTPLSDVAPLDAPAAVQVVPEPTWLLTQGAALLWLGLFARRRRKGSEGTA